MFHRILQLLVFGPLLLGCTVGILLAQGTDRKRVAGEYLIESALKPGMVLDVTDAKAEDLSLIQLAGPGDQANRRWRLIRVGDSEYMIETVLKEGFVLDVREAKSDDGTLIQLGGGGVDQQNRRWRLIPVSNGEYMIETALKKNVFLDVKDANAENLATIQLGGSNDDGRDQPNRRWRLLRVDLK
jgi:Ricin-type beta-trefoil lectin domain-like